MKISSSLLLLVSLFTATSGVAQTDLRLFPMHCEEILIDTKLYPRPEKFDGNVWIGRIINPGKSGGFQVALEADPKKYEYEDIRHSLEGMEPVAFPALGAAVGDFFGYGAVQFDYSEFQKIWLSVFPSRGELNGRIDQFNDLISNNPSDPAFMAYKYFKPRNAPWKKRGRYFLEKFAYDRLWPLEDSGHLYIHDVNYHFGLSFMPLEFSRLVEIQARFALKFLDWLKESDPQSAKLKILGQISSKNGKIMIHKKRSIYDFLPEALIRDIDFGNANTLNNFKIIDKMFLDPFMSSLLDLRPQEKHRIFVAVREFTGDFKSPADRLKNLLSNSGYNTKDENIENIIFAKIDEFSALHPELLGHNPYENITNSEIWEIILRRYHAIADVVEQKINSAKTVQTPIEK